MANESISMADDNLMAKPNSVQKQQQQQQHNRHQLRTM